MTTSVFNALWFGLKGEQIFYIKYFLVKNDKRVRYNCCGLPKTGVRVEWSSASPAAAATHKKLIVKRLGTKEQYCLCLVC